MFVSVIANVRQLSLSQPLHPVSLRTILILSYLLRPAVAMSLSFSFPHQRPTCIFFSPVRATCPINAFPLLFELAISEIRILKEEFVDVIK